MNDKIHEDVDTAEFKIKKYVDPVTGETKEHKTRPHRIHFAASRKGGVPAQDTEAYKKGKAQISFAHGEDDGQKGISEAKRTKIVKQQVPVDDDRRGCTTSVDDIRKEASDICQVCGQTPCNCTHIGAAMDNEKNALDEVLTKKASAGEWIHDFVKSKDPKFAGKSKKERTRQALAAYYAKQRNEDVEQIDEISKKTLGSYLGKATDSLAMRYADLQGKKQDRDEIARFRNRLGDMGGHQVGSEIEKLTKRTSKDIDKAHDKVSVRHAGIKKAIGKLTKEDHDVYNGMGSQKVVSVVGHPSDSNKWCVLLADPRKNEMEKTWLSQFVSTHDTEDAAQKAANEFAKMNKLPFVAAHEIEESIQVEEKTFKKFKSWVKEGPSGHAKDLEASTRGKAKAERTDEETEMDEAAIVGKKVVTGTYGKSHQPDPVRDAYGHIIRRPKEDEGEKKQEQPKEKRGRGRPRKARPEDKYSGAKKLQDILMKHALKRQA